MPIFYMFYRNNKKAGLFVLMFLTKSTILQSCRDDLQGQWSGVLLAERQRSASCAESRKLHHGLGIKVNIFKGLDI